MASQKKSSPKSGRNTSSRTAEGTKRKPAARKRSTNKKKKKLPIPAGTAIAIAATIVLLLIVLPMVRNRAKWAEGEQLPPMSFSAIGIDISHNNRGPIQWDSLYVLTDKAGHMHKSMDDAQKVYSVKFVFIKATEGVSMRDPEFKGNWAAAGEHDIQRGAYHFFRSSKDGKAQARNFIATVGELRHGDLPPVLDIETMHRGCTRKLLNDRALQWLEAVSAAYGRKPIIYTSDSYLRDILDERITGNYPIWVAHYGVDSPDAGNWDYWQFTEKGVVHGVPDPVDMSLRR